MEGEWIEKLEDVTARFRMGEAEVARAFFKSPRPLNRHVKWLKHQILVLPLHSNGGCCEDRVVYRVFVSRKD